MPTPTGASTPRKYRPSSGTNEARKFITEQHLEVSTQIVSFLPGKVVLKKEVKSLWCGLPLEKMREAIQVGEVYIFLWIEDSQVDRL